MEQKMIKDTIVNGSHNAPHRSLYKALGLTREELDRPLIGIVSSYNEIVPGHMNLDKITEAVKLGVAMAGGTPIMFPAIAVCDGIAMGHVGMKYSLVTRDLIADSTEAMVMAHGFDGLVMIPNCDKNVPGLLMASARLNIPTVFVSGGPMLAGRVDGKKRSLSAMFEAVGSYKAGTIDDCKLCEYEDKACPTCGSCSGMYTANSMNCLTEALGMGLAGNGTIPAVYSERIKLAKHAGMKVMELYEKNIRPRDIMTEEAFRNALTVDMALGCSTNSMLHLPAIAHAAGVDVEAELGRVGDTGFGGEGTGEATPDVFTDVEESAEFIRRTGVEALAIAIGNLHGRYVATPKLNIGRLKEIASRNELPLVLHGGSGTSEEDFKSCIHNGICKINVATALQMAVTDAVRKYLSENEAAGYIDTKSVIVEATKESVKQHILLFESNGKA